MASLHLYIGNMHCGGCEKAVEGAVSALEGVISVKSDYGQGEAWVTYQPPCNAHRIQEAIEKAGYEVVDRPQGRWDGVYLLVILLGLFVIARQLGWTEIFRAFPAVSEEQVGYAALFLIGLLTSVHCIAMCGGINLSQSVSGQEKAPVRRSLLYNLGRLTSYTVIGGILGLAGEAAAITLRLRSVIGLAAGVLMLLMGVNMLGNFHLFFRLTPHFPKWLPRGLAALRQRGPFAVGLANGLMPCGPLQSMQIYAIAGGGLLTGALSMFFFCLGTIPLVLLCGAAAGVLRLKWKRRMLQVSSALLVLLGLFMVQNNLALAGITMPGSYSGTEPVIAVVRDGAQYLTTQLRANGYDDIQVEAGIPVIWTIEVAAEDLNGCNNELVLPAFGQQIRLQESVTEITFLPEKAGTYSYSCWMGMLKNTITVIESGED